MGDPTTVSRETSRYASLDGLRGLAAFAVLVHHCFLVSPQLSAAVDGNGTGPFDSWVWWATYSPLHLVWAGQEAVFVFFILSGFVLTLPLVRSPRPLWAAYYPKRIVRIYLPVWGSLLLAVLMAWTVPRVASSEFSAWLNLHGSPSNVLADAFLLGGASSLNSPLWSLQWEMIFSLLLPLYWLGAVCCRRVWLFGVSGLAILIGLAEQTNVAGLVVLPMFGIGALVAVRRDVVERWATMLGPWGWSVLVGTSITLLSANWLFPQLAVSISMVTIGGVLLLFIFIGCKSGIALGSNFVLRWLGTRSFSLYLVHEPIVVSVAFALHSTNPFQVASIAAPLSLLASEAFFRFLERPSQLLAGYVGRIATDGMGLRNISAHSSSKRS